MYKKGKEGNQKEEACHVQYAGCRKCRGKNGGTLTILTRIGMECPGQDPEASADELPPRARLGNQKGETGRPVWHFGRQLERSTPECKG